MSLLISHGDTGSGKTLFATVQQLTTAGIANYWNATTSTWDAVKPAIADRKITLTEGTGEDLKVYTGAIATALGSYTGQAIVQVHDDNVGDLPVNGGIGQVYFSSGVEQTIGSITTATISPVALKKSRIWRIRDTGEFSTATETLELTVGTTTVVGMDFSKILNPGADLTGTPTVSVDQVVSGVAPGLSSVSLSQDRKEVHVTATASTAGRYRFLFTAQSTDGDTFAARGFMDVN